MYRRVCGGHRTRASDQVLPKQAQGKGHDPTLPLQQGQAVLCAQVSTGYPYLLKEDCAKSC